MATPALYERELSKLDALSASLAKTLSERGVETQRAQLAAKIGMVAFVQASQAWVDDSTGGLPARIQTSFGNSSGCSPLPRSRRVQHERPLLQLRNP